MNYVFNKFTIIVVIGVVFITVMTFNEAAKFVTKVRARNVLVYSAWLDQQGSTYATQEKCQQITSSICNFSECDFVPIGTSVEEVCGDDFSKGWRPTSVTIPEFYQSINEIRLRIETVSSVGILSILPQEDEMTYTSESSGEIVTQKKIAITMQDSLFMTNKFILYEFIRLAEDADESEDIKNDETIYRISIVSDTLQDDNADDTASISCQASTCTREVADIKNAIIRLWGEDLAEE